MALANGEWERMGGPLLSRASARRDRKKEWGKGVAGSRYGVHGTRRRAAGACMAGASAGTMPPTLCGGRGAAAAQLSFFFFFFFLESLESPDSKPHFWSPSTPRHCRGGGRAEWQGERRHWGRAPLAPHPQRCRSVAQHSAAWHSMAQSGTAWHSVARHTSMLNSSTSSSYGMRPQMRQCAGATIQFWASSKSHTRFSAWVSMSSRKLRV